jgi:hypothetical protein
MNTERTIRRPNMSFIVRLWPSDGVSPEMRGEVEHITTGEKRLFVDHRSLMALLQSWQRDLEAVH